MAGLNPKYREIEVLRDPDGVICVITERIDSDQAYHSFCIMKEYERSGQTIRTAYLSRRHGPAVRRLLTQIEEWYDKQVEKTFAARRAAR